MTSPIRNAVIDLLSARGQPVEVGDEEPLFTSGRLDSLAAVELMLLLERDYGVDLSDPDFDVSLLDTLSDLEAFAQGRTTGK